MIRTSGIARLLLVLLHHHQVQATRRSFSFVGHHHHHGLVGTATWSDRSLMGSSRRRHISAPSSSLLFLRLSPHRHPPTNNVCGAATRSTSWSSDSSNSQKPDSTTAVAFGKAQRALERLAQRGKSWKRLRHLVELALVSSTTTTIADVGTDHGLLAMALAVSGKFERVYGVDVSLEALQNGAWKLHRQVQQQTLSLAKTAPPQDSSSPSTQKSTSFHHNAADWPVEFLVGDGLWPLQSGQADTICIAGMGVHTMVEILTQTSTTLSSNSDDTASKFLLDELGSQRLILQPTNARPRHLIRLYDTLRDMGWTVTDERMEYLSSRWYLSSCFVRQRDDQSVDAGDILPGALLASTTTTPVEMRRQFLDWVSHNCRWIRQDLEKNGSISHPREVVWLNEFLDLVAIQPRLLGK